MPSMLFRVDFNLIRSIIYHGQIGRSPDVLRQQTKKRRRMIPLSHCSIVSSLGMNLYQCKVLNCLLRVGKFQSLVVEIAKWKLSIRLTAVCREWQVPNRTGCIDLMPGSVSICCSIIARVHTSRFQYFLLCFNSDFFVSISMWNYKMSYTIIVGYWNLPNNSMNSLAGITNSESASLHGQVCIDSICHEIKVNY